MIKSISKRITERRAALALALSLFTLDSILTLLGQPAYSQRIAGNVNEANEIFSFAMRNGWLFHALVTACWIAAISASILSFNKFLSLAFTFAWTIGHTIGAASWLFYSSKFNIASWAIYPISIIIGLAAALTAKSILSPKTT